MQQKYKRRQPKPSSKLEYSSSSKEELLEAVFCESMKRGCSQGETRWSPRTEFTTGMVI